MRIQYKEQMYRLLQAGRFGNYPRSWDGYHPLLMSDYRGKVGIRSKQWSNPVREYQIPFDDIPIVLARIGQSTINGGLVFSEALPDHLTTIQGEYGYNECSGLRLTYTHVGQPMKQAFDSECCTQVNGTAARLLLKQYMPACDYEWLHELLEDFSGATVEFSTFSVPVGTQRGSYTIFWEVRHY